MGGIIIDSPRIYSHHLGEEKVLMSPNSLSAVIANFELLDFCSNSLKVAPFKGTDLISINLRGTNAEQIKRCLVSYHKAIEEWENERYGYLSADSIYNELNSKTPANMSVQHYRNSYRASKILFTLNILPVGYSSTVTKFILFFMLSGLISIGIFHGYKLLNYIKTI